LIKFTHIDHVQLAMPQGKEASARAFYCDVLGMIELEKPEALKARGGAWFSSGPVQIHLGVEDDFRPAKNAHPALAIHGGSVVRQKLAQSGFAVRDDDMIPGTKRFFTDDCFGNRIEFIELD
jgi:catechol 2,3-dioxygenase-like lactoylglutathione lyase family enzyme